ncbi:DUF6603 domain-containing protein [Chondromyces crocatus]|uniref:DUF6603 domain-containing protein n=1 Tax=Chondromyces crocatus TaxID=52 RepID=A0A0K1EGA3_CHOCO|nr:DUF6603 domain-containing protein [Chondromyces crocatus]AKT39603.1 uncharacterized protein CMC5_037520 [Chondromyces crocatus]
MTSSKSLKDLTNADLLPAPIHQSLALDAQAPVPVTWLKTIKQVIEGPPDQPISWIPLQKSLGPFDFEQVGLQLHDDETLWVYVDGSFAAYGFSVTPKGLAVSSPIHDLSPAVHLDGFGVAYKNDALTLGLALQRAQRTDADGNATTEYDGTGAIQFTVGKSAVGLSIIGSWASYEGTPALFLYGVVAVPIAFPPFFDIKAVSLGFGFNNSLSVPPIDKVTEFPLVAEAIDGTMQQVDAKGSNMASILSSELDSLASYIKPVPGAGFLAVGLKFSAFRVIDGFVLLSADLGAHTFEIDVLGVADLVVPYVEGKRKVSPLIEMRMLLEASFAPFDGYFGIIAELDPSSYVFMKSCHITGGFASYVWFAQEHAGDFVITLGGYHPRYVVPSHYPTVPRLGVDWQIDKFTHLKGDLYYALCAHAMMAGGYAEIHFDCAGVYADFKVGADFLISWQPYYYDIDVGIDLRGGVDFVGPIDVGASIHLWGPDFGGYASVRVLFITITVSFGDQSSIYPLAVDWDAFQDNLPDDDGMCSLAVSTGLRQQVTDTDGETPVYVIDPKAFAISASSAIPTKTATCGPDDTPIDLQGACTNFGIPAMAVASGDLLVSQKLTITYGDDATPAEDRFAFTPVERKSPTSLWGQPHTVPGHDDRIMTPDVNDPEFVTENGHDTLGGFSIVPAKAPKPGMTALLDASVLQYDTLLRRDVYQWQPLAAWVDSGEGDTQRRDDIAASLGPSTTRDQILGAMGFDPAADVQVDPQAIATSFVIAPAVHAH